MPAAFASAILLALQSAGEIPASNVSSPGQAGADADVVRAADDAFGRRVGIEEVGLYSETEVRGFSLQSAGNYRLDGHYFVRASSPVMPIVQGSMVRVGANGLRTDFAAPSGVFHYDLVSGAGGTFGSVEAGWWGGSGPALVGRFGSTDARERLALAGGVQFNPWQRYGDGSGGTYAAIGAVPRWSPAPGVRAAAIASRSWFRPQTDTLFASPAGVPPRVRRNLYRGQDWMVGETNGTLAGLMMDIERGGWQAGASLFLSAADDPRTMFNLITLPVGGGPAEYLVVVTPDQRFRSFAGEVFAARTFATGRLTHRLIAMARWRDSLARTNPGVSAILGSIDDLDGPPRFAKPQFRFGSGGMHDDVSQYGLGFGYRLSIGDRLELRADAQKTRYARRTATPDGTRAGRTTAPILYSASAALALTARTTLFASVARGLEEAGVAPGNALNRGTVLPATLTRQSELGLKHQIDGGPALIAGLFDIRKPLAGLGVDGIYGFVGDVSHRGVELSLAGPVADGLSAVLGATLFEAALSGVLVDNRIIGPEPVGRAEQAMLASLTWQVPGVPALTLDGGVSLRGGREANRENSLDLPAYATFHAGLRKSMSIDGVPLTLRARVTNIFNAFAWNATASGLFAFNGPRAVTFTVTADL